MPNDIITPTTTLAEFRFLSDYGRRAATFRATASADSIVMTIAIFQIREGPIYDGFRTKWPFVPVVRKGIS